MGYTYAKAMERSRLARGIRGSETRHVDQHEYYRQCQIKKLHLSYAKAYISISGSQADYLTEKLFASAAFRSKVNDNSENISGFC